MKILKLAKGNVAEFIDRLSSFGEIDGPAKRDGAN